jgi:hypothetical protein
MRDHPHMAYFPSRRLARKKRTPLSAEFLYLLVVLAAGVATAYWAGHRIGMDLSGIETVVSVLGIDESVGIPHQAGYAQPTTQDAAAPFCEAGQTPAFVNGIATLKQQVGDAMGTAVECEHASSTAGDMIQQTSTGLAVYSSLTETETFTDGWRHWELSTSGLVTWDGTEAEPPSADQPNNG